MPDLATYLAFLAAVLAYQLSGPGPDMLLVMSRGVGQGWRVALSTALGCVAAGVIQIPLLALGLASLVASSPVAYEILRWAGAGYLIYLGIALLLPRRNAARVESVVDSTPGVAWGSAFRQGMVCNLTNPTVLIFMLAILPQFVDPASGPAWNATAGSGSHDEGHWPVHSWDGRLGLGRGRRLALPPQPVAGMAGAFCRRRDDRSRAAPAFRRRGAPGIALRREVPN